MRVRGAYCQFVCRDHPGNLIDFIRLNGFEVIILPSHNILANGENQPNLRTPYAAWLGCSLDVDAVQTKAVLKKRTCDWLVVDHYALDAQWELAVAPTYLNLMVIDDLADRPHVCDVLLDQNLIEGMNTRYQGKIPENCVSLIGPRYALVRPEFNEMRHLSISRRTPPVRERLLVFLGGSDEENEIGEVLDGIKLAKRPWEHVDIVVGQSFPLIYSLKKQVATMTSATLHIQTSDMARLMTDADLALTAGGSVTWEKCTLGLPSLVVIQGDNQYAIAMAMNARGAQRTIGLGKELTPRMYAQLLDSVNVSEMALMAETASTICDGLGVASVLNTLGI